MLAAVVESGCLNHYFLDELCQKDYGQVEESNPIVRSVFINHTSKHTALQENAWCACEDGVEGDSQYRFE
jgi:hypothetical protein